MMKSWVGQMMVLPQELLGMMFRTIGYALTVVWVKKILK
jgi:hypothetical protein